MVSQKYDNADLSPAPPGDQSGHPTHDSGMQHPYLACHALLDRIWRRRLFHGLVWFISPFTAFLAALTGVVVALSRLAPEAGKLEDTPSHLLVAFGHEIGSAANWIATRSDGVLLVWMIVLVPILKLFQWCASLAPLTSHESMQRISRILEHSHEQLVEDPSPDHTYRLTLFRQRKCVGLGQWLGICRRSFDTYKRSGTVFSISRDGKQYCTGVAGQAWWQAVHNNRAVLFAGNNLPEGVAFIGAPQNTVVAAEKMRLTKEAVCFATIPIIKNGRVWGILVFDTDNDQWARRSPQQRKAFIKNLEFTAHAIITVL